MRQLNQNKRKMYYSNLCSSDLVDSKNNNLMDHEANDLVYHVSGATPIRQDIYERDSEGNIIYTNIDGVDYPVLSESVTFYDPPTIFKANISFNSGETMMAEYGLDVSGYNAIISADKGKLKFNERTLIWFESTPEVDEYGHAIPETADYRVIAIKTSLNEERFILKKRVDDE